MKKKYKVILVLLLIIILALTITIGITMATDINDLNNAPVDDTFHNTGNAAVRVLTTIGMVASVVVLVILGIKFMAGSVEEKAAYKKSLFPYVIGAVLIFSASTIASVIYNVAKSL